MNLENLTEKMAKIGSNLNKIGLSVFLLSSVYTFIEYNKLDTMKEIGRQTQVFEMNYSKYEKGVNLGHYGLLVGISISLLGTLASLPRDILSKHKHKMESK